MKFPWFNKKQKTAFVSIGPNTPSPEIKSVPNFDPFKVIMIEWSYYKGPVVKKPPVEIWSYDLSEDILVDIERDGFANRGGGNEDAGGGRNYKKA